MDRTAMESSQSEIEKLVLGALLSPRAPPLMGYAPPADTLRLADTIR
jgi:hypothetical protein